MLNVYRTALGPILHLQGRFVKRNTIRLPEPHGPRSGSITGTSGSDLRILFVGDSSAAGVGVEHQREALALPSARLLAQRLNRPVSWQLLARTGLNTEEAREFVRCSSIEPADVVVMSLGTNDVTSQQPPRTFARNYLALLDELSARTGAVAAVLTGLPPLRILPAAPQPLRWYLGQYAAELDSKLRAMADRCGALSYCSLEWAAKPAEMAADKFHPGSGQYKTWSRLICNHIEALLLSHAGEPNSG